MKAQIVPVVVFVEDDGRVSNISFSQTTAEFMLALIDEYAQDEPDGGEKKRKEVEKARTVVESANLPVETTMADSHYCAMSGVAEGLRLTEEQLLKRNGDAVPKELFPGFALCCFVRGGRHGLRLAFSREAAKALYDEPQPIPFPTPTRKEVEYAKSTIDDMRLPFPKNRVQLDEELAEMLRSHSQPHR